MTGEGSANTITNKKVGYDARLKGAKCKRMLWETGKKARNLAWKGWAAGQETPGATTGESEGSEGRAVRRPEWEACRMHSGLAMASLVCGSDRRERGDEQ